MSQERIPDKEPARHLFPEFTGTSGLVHEEVAGLTDDQLDWESDRWEWSKWSIRRQISHMASLTYRWLLSRWGDQLFPDGSGIAPDLVEALAESPHDRRLDENRFWEMPDIERALNDALSLAESVLERRTAGDMRAITVSLSQGSHWDVMIKAHPYGVERDPATGLSTLTLEATFRHMYFEHITHLYNVQRLKRAQGLEARVELPHVGYWTLPEWDRSEP
ncbi:MAG: hypothetical protein ACOC5M_03670 [Chloroflexota bacterium]